MKMFIPEIGSRITLNEDWFVIANNLEWKTRINLEEKGLITENTNDDGNVINRTFTIPKGYTLSIKAIKLKRGASTSNGVTFYVPKPKQPDDKFGQSQFTVLLPDLLDMEFELEECQKETLEFVMKFLEDIREEYGGGNEIYREVEKVLLDGKNIISFRPQQTIDSFIKSVTKRFEKYDYNDYRYKEEIKHINKRFNSYNRKHKIEKVLSS